MKRKVTSLILVLAVCLCMCGCDSEDVPDMLLSPLAMVANFTAETIEIKTVDKDIIDKCFEKIKAGPATLTLPMNVSDLPEGIVLNPERYEEESANSYNGMNTIVTEMYLGEETQCIGCAIILCTDAKNCSDGVIMGLIFFSSEVNAVLGDVSLNMSYDEISKAFDCDDTVDGGCVYVSRDGRSVYFSNFAYSFYENNEKYPDYVCISTDAELYASYTKL